MHLQCVEKFFLEGLNANEIFSYAPTAGVRELREVWKKRQDSENKRANHSTLPVVVGGITHGLSVVGDVFFDDKTLTLGSVYSVSLSEKLFRKYCSNRVKYCFFSLSLIVFR